MSNPLAKVVRKSGAKKAPKQKPVPVKIVSESPGIGSPDTDMKWKAESGLRTLAEADRILDEGRRWRRL